MAPRLFKTAFTLIELLLSLVVLTMLSIVLFGMLSQASDLWRNNRSRVEAFQAARTALERITRQLSQATLNTYLDYYDSTGQSRSDFARKASGTDPRVLENFIPTRYDWASELQFVSGDAAALIGDVAGGETPSHAVFFVAPTGRTGSNPSSLKYKNLDTLINALGYYVKYSSDQDEIPPFLKGNVQPRYRYRLMEMNQPSENLQIYDSSAMGSWYKEAIKLTDKANPSTFVLAENVVALIVRPRVSTADAASPLGKEIESTYSFDSKDGSKNVRNQLPPLVQVTLVAIAEESAQRYARAHGDGAPQLVENGNFSDPAQFNEDLQNLEDRLNALKMNFRVFTTDVSIRGSKSSLTPP